MLRFVDTLKQIIADTQATGGMTIERASPSPQLLQRLRAYAVQCLAEATSVYPLEEWFIEGAFDEHVRVCIVHLQKLGISQDDQTYQLISKVIDAVMRENHRVKDERNFEAQLIRSLTIVWEDMGDDQTFLYTLAQSRWLISWDYQKSLWKPTGLGRMFMELSAVQAATFFLSIDTSLAAGKRDFHYISEYMLRYLQSLDSGKKEPVNELMLHYHQNMLIRLGIIFRDSDTETIREDMLSVTPIAKTIFRTILSQDNPFSDTALAIIRTEEFGGTFNTFGSEINEILRMVDQTDLVDRTNQESIHTSIQLYHAKKYLNSLRVVYPSIEAIMNTMLIKAGEVPERFSGLVAKAQCLERQGIIPYDVSHAMEVFTGRNKVVHGNFSPPDEYVHPICIHAFLYLRRLLTEYHPTS